MKYIAKKITNIKNSHSDTDAELIGKIARMVSREAGGMDMRVATAFASSQVESYKGLDIKLN